MTQVLLLVNSTTRLCLWYWQFPAAAARGRSASFHPNR